MPNQPETTSTNPPRQRYIWDGDGAFSRRENDVLVTYRKGDFVDLSPRGAYNCRGSLKTEGGLLIPLTRPDGKPTFDGISHPVVDQPPQPVYPHARLGILSRIPDDDLDLTEDPNATRVEEPTHDEAQKEAQAELAGKPGRRVGRPARALRVAEGSN